MCLQSDRCASTRNDCLRQFWLNFLVVTEYTVSSLICSPPACHVTCRVIRRRRRLSFIGCSRLGSLIANESIATQLFASSCISRCQHRNHLTACSTRALPPVRSPSGCRVVQEGNCWELLRARLLPWGGRSRRRPECPGGALAPFAHRGGGRAVEAPLRHERREPPPHSPPPSPIPWALPHLRFCIFPSLSEQPLPSPKCPSPLRSSPLRFVTVCAAAPRRARWPRERRAQGDACTDPTERGAEDGQRRPDSQQRGSHRRADGGGWTRARGRLRPPRHPLLARRVGTSDADAQRMSAWPLPTR